MATSVPNIDTPKGSRMIPDHQMQFFLRLRNLFLGGVLLLCKEYSQYIYSKPY